MKLSQKNESKERRDTQLNFEEKSSNFESVDLKDIANYFLNKINEDTQKIE